MASSSLVGPADGDWLPRPMASPEQADPSLQLYVCGWCQLVSASGGVIPSGVSRCSRLVLDSRRHAEAGASDADGLAGRSRVEKCLSRAMLCQSLWSRRPLPFGCSDPWQ